MKLNIKKPSQALNAAFLKVKPIRADFDKFKDNLKSLISGIVPAESEEFHKNLISLFLRETYLGHRYYINTNNKTDLVIHTGEGANSNVGVLIETKRPKTSAEMPTRENINVKAFHELVLYYMRERITKKNLDIKHLIATNVYEWFIFDSNMFQKCFADNKDFVKRFQDFEEGRLTDKVTSTFYNEIAKPYIETLDEIPVTYFDLRTYQDILNIEINTKKLSENLQLDFGEAEALEQEKQLIELYKVLSAEHLLKLPFLNDSNTLDRQFYTELLHIIGLSEVTESGKKLIKRKEIAERDSGSLIENTIARLQSLNRLSNFSDKPEYGETKEERLFNIALDLCLTWINRILFLKLLESQLLGYHRGNRDYSFLNYKTIGNYGALENLFFNVLALRPQERNAENKIFEKVPYLNSSLFELTETENKGIVISNLFDDKTIKVLTPTVLKDSKGNQIKATRNLLEYLFGFLSAYDFSSEGSLEIQEQNKTLINASVLGLIFEKINGYKDGSFFTPGFITMYMAREAIRPAVIQKFNEAKGWQCKDLIDLANKIEDIKEANQIFNTIRVCDPAVGSGHFLVSALNELITVKRELGILTNTKGIKIRDYYIKIENDELIITDTNNQLFEYNKNDVASRELQEALFHEKRTLIENCLFGVDINPNSVKICRLRLWIELLKNAYYTAESSYTELETLPNIDINIKTGNSLISRFPIDADLSVALNKSKWDIESYRTTVQSYKNTDDRDVKADLMKLIEDIKNNFSNEISSNNADVKKLERLEKEYYDAFEQSHLLANELTETEAKRLEKRKEKMLAEISKQKQIVDDLRTNKIYDNAFEWRFEFPELLDDNGDFLGFDVVIGNPPYGVSVKGKERIHLVTNIGKVPDFEIYYWFIERGHTLLKKLGIISMIIPNTILFNLFAMQYRLNLFNMWDIKEILDCTNLKIFQDASVRNIIFQFVKEQTKFKTLSYKKTSNIETFKELISNEIIKIPIENVEINNINWGLIFRLDDIVLSLVKKIRTKNKVGEYYKSTQGYIPYRKSDLIKEYGIEKAEDIVINRLWHSEYKINDEYKEEIFGESISKYNYKKTNSFVWYGKHLATYVDPIYFQQKRILIREITNPGIIACIVEEEFVNDPQIIVVIEQNIEYTLEYLWAILNSKLATFYHFNSSPKATKGAFPKILVYDVNNFPLPSKIDRLSTSQMESLVHRILIKKRHDPTADTSDLEHHIDLLVYKLYELTYDEVKIIDPDFDAVLSRFAFTPADYESKSIEELAGIQY